jgi:hypothetical protein
MNLVKLAAGGWDIDLPLAGVVVPLGVTFAEFKADLRRGSRARPWSCAGHRRWLGQPSHPVSTLILLKRLTYTLESFTLLLASHIKN